MILSLLHKLERAVAERQRSEQLALAAALHDKLCAQLADEASAQLELYAMMTCSLLALVEQSEDEAARLKLLDAALESQRQLDAALTHSLRQLSAATLQQLS